MDVPYSIAAGSIEQCVAPSVGPSNAKAAADRGQPICIDGCRNRKGRPRRARERNDCYGCHTEVGAHVIRLDAGHYPVELKVIAPMNAEHGVLLPEVARPSVCLRNGI